MPIELTECDWISVFMWAFNRLATYSGSSMLLAKVSWDRLQVSGLTGLGCSRRMDGWRYEDWV